MFQAALAFVLSKRFDVRPQFVDMTDQARIKRGWQLDCFDISPTELNIFLAPILQFGVKISNSMRIIDGLSIPGFVIENSSGKLVEFSKPPILISGYWQRARYFEGHEKEIQELFRIPGTSVRNEITAATDAPKVAIHLRRGDYVTDPAAQRIHLVCDEAWYREAWRSTLDAIPDAHGFVFSDDPAWALACLGPASNLTYMPFSPDAHPSMDMMQMAACDHFIISNSSYSWWGAWLGQAADKRVTAPREWFRGRSTAKLGICPSDWLML
jgi:hypothetical protein